MLNGTDCNSRNFNNKNTSGQYNHGTERTGDEILHRLFPAARGDLVDFEIANPQDYARRHYLPELRQHEAFDRIRPRSFLRRLIRTSLRRGNIGVDSDLYIRQVNLLPNHSCLRK